MLTGEEAEERRGGEGKWGDKEMRQIRAQRDVWDAHTSRDWPGFSNSFSDIYYARQREMGEEEGGEERTLSAI